MDTGPVSKQGRRGFIRLLYAAGYSLKGLRAAFRHEAAFRQEVVLLVVLLPVAVWLGKTGIEQALLIASLLLVLVVELINSAIEAAVDRISEERHELSGRAKDIGSAAVFIAIINAMLIWILVLTGR